MHFCSVLYAPCYHLSLELSFTLHYSLFTLHLLIRSFSLEDDTDCFKKNFQIKAKRPVFNIKHIKFHPMTEAQFASSSNLPETGDARFDAKALHMPVIIFFDFFRYWRAWSDEAHIAFQDIPELWQFV